MLGRCGKVSDSFTRFFCLLALQQHKQQEVFEINALVQNQEEVTDLCFLSPSLAALMNRKKPNKHTPYRPAENIQLNIEVSFQIKHLNDFRGKS